MTSRQATIQNEELTAEYDALVGCAIEKINASKQDLWGAAQQIWMLYVNHPLREGGFTQTICDATHRDKSSIYGWRNAWQMRRLIDQALGSPADHVLPTTFYSVAYDARNNLPISAIIELMDIAAHDNKPVRWLGAQLGGKDLTDDAWDLRAGKACKSVAQLLSDAELLGKPAEKREFLSDALRALKAAKE